MKFSALLIAGFLFIWIIPLARAHVVVSPHETGIGSFETFIVAVPSEREIPTISIRLVLPEGLEFVTPNVKPGWTIDLKREEDKVTEIIWSGGTIPPHFRDEFIFSAKAPAHTTTLTWKAYQTYQDGSMVAWDRAEHEQPKNEDGSPDFSQFGPHSQTQVIDDLVNRPETGEDANQGLKTNLTLGLSIAGVLLAAFALRRTL